MKKLTALVLLTASFFSFDVSANEIPFLSFTSANRYQESTTDFDEVDDARNFTSEMLFSESQLRLNRNLTEDELARIVRTKPQFETLNMLSLNFVPSFGLDFSYKYRDVNDAQITNFYIPDQFNDVNLNEYGVALRKSISYSKYGFYVRGAYKHIDREGIIEFFPDVEEDIDHYEVNVAISRTFEENSLTVYPTYVFQDIQLDIPEPYDRKRDILAITFTYGKQASLSKLQEAIRPISAIENIFERRFDMRGIYFFGGIVYDKEEFGNTDVIKNDYFIGTTFPLGQFDIAIQPNIFTSEVEGDESQDNSQYRTDMTMYYQISEVLLLSIPFRHDVAIEGPDDFENYKLGIELSYSLTSKKHSNVKLFTSLRYDHQRFFNLGKDLDLFVANLTFGF
jgi:hypothetical protein